MTQNDKKSLIEAIEWEKGSYLDNEMYDYGAVAMANNIIEIIQNMPVETPAKHCCGKCRAEQ